MGANFDARARVVRGAVKGCPCSLYEQDPIDREVTEVLSFLARGA